MGDHAPKLLKRGRMARTELILWRGRPAVRKTLDPIVRIPVLTAQFGRWVLWRELRQLERAKGVPGVPRVFARPAPNIYIREYFEGEALPRAPAPPVSFFRKLEVIVAALHERGITHNDLHKEANVIVRSDGSPGVLDFQLSLSLRPGSDLYRLLVRFDRYHVVKNMRHRTGCTLTPEESELVKSTRRLRALMRGALKKPANLLTRRLFPRLLGKLPTDTDP